jgi:uncharacterized protein involved in response to NO
MSQRSLLEPILALPGKQRRPALLAKGFRPFFLLAASFAFLAVPVWTLMFAGKLGGTAYLGPMYWHAHEMVFGFTIAVIAGFLLTAVGNWTGRETASGLSLALLALLWVLGRIAVLFGDALNVPIAAIVDLAFLPALAIFCARALIGAKNARNYPFVAVLGALSLSNLGVHLGALGVYPEWLQLGNLVAVDLIVLLIVLIGGRVIPIFTRNATSATSIRSLPWLDRLAAISMAALTVADALAASSKITGGLAALGALAVLGRTRFWGAPMTFRQPLLWVLHVGHAFVALGLLLRAAAAMTPYVPPSAAIHALTAGAIGTMTIGMMTRVALGHTGRMLAVSRTIATAFVLVIAGTGLRIVAAWIPASLYTSLLSAAGLSWAAGFAIYTAVYAPMLFAPRVDGKPG